MTPKRTPIPVNDHEAVVVLTRGMVALIDLEDAEVVGRHLWHAYQNRDGTWYARSSNPSGVRPASIRMHRLVMGMGAGRSRQVDHIDGYGLNNRKSNLRVVTNSQNMMNRGATRRGSSAFKGVSFDRCTGKWRAHIAIDGKGRWLPGLHDDEATAARLYDAAAIRLHGEFAVVNFPDEHALVREEGSSSS